MLKFDSLKKIHLNYINWFNNSYKFSAEQLGIFRIFYISFLVFIFGIPTYSSKIAAFPKGVFNPPPFFSAFFDALPPLSYFQITDVLIFIGFFFILIGLFTKFWSVLTASLIIINNGFIFSTGKIDHIFLVWFTLLALSFSGWEKSFSIDGKLFTNIKIRNWIVSLISLCIGFGFFVSGLIKLVSGWLSLSDSMLRAFFLRNFYVQKKQDLLAPYLENFNFQLFWESGDWITIFLEIGFLIAIFRPSLFRLFTVLAVFFHGMVMLMFNIGFYAYIGMYLLFWLHLIPKSFTDKLSDKLNQMKKNKLSFILLLYVPIGLFILRYFYPTTPKLISTSILLISFSISLFIMVFKPMMIFTDTHFSKKDKRIIYFDGVCNLCNSFIQFVIKRDSEDKFMFQTLQESLGSENEFESIFLKRNDKLIDKSTAFLNIVRELNGFWPYLYLFILVPRPIRDFVYTITAKNRYKWFGKKDVCMVPTAKMKDKFIN